MFTFKLKCILHKTELSDTSISYSKNKFQIFFSKTNSLFNSPSIEKEPHKTCKIFQCLHELSIPKCHRNVYKNYNNNTNISLFDHFILIQYIKGLIKWSNNEVCWWWWCFVLGFFCFVLFFVFCFVVLLLLFLFCFVLSLFLFLFFVLNSYKHFCDTWEYLFHVNIEISYMSCVALSLWMESWTMN